MNHRNRHKKLSRKTNHRKSLLINLCKSLINHEQIHTTITKAKSCRPIIEKMITTASNDTLHNRRKIMKKLGGYTKELLKLFQNIAPRYVERKGGYTRIIKIGYRKGDCAPTAMIQLV